MSPVTSSTTRKLHFHQRRQAQIFAKDLVDLQPDVI
jgi:hypothetical protein